MKKFLVLVLTLCLITTLFTVTPVSANNYWSGVAVGVGSAILLSHIVNAPRPYPPVRAYGPPPPPVYRERWVPVRVIPSHGYYVSHWRHPGHDQWHYPVH